MEITSSYGLKSWGKGLFGRLEEKHGGCLDFSVGVKGQEEIFSLVLC